MEITLVLKLDPAFEKLIEKLLGGVDRTAKPAATTPALVKQMAASNASAPVTGAAETTEEITLESVRALIGEKSKAKTEGGEGKRDECKGVLETMGFKKLTDVPAEKYAELYKLIKAL